MQRKKYLFYIVIVMFSATDFVLGQELSKVWVSDLGNGQYKNPIIHADYSDPDVCCVGDNFYMTASSFDAVPGLPILHSRDLVNWQLIGHALKRQPPYDHYAKTQQGNGVWAPAIRFYKDEFYIYYPDPDFGIYLIKAKDPAGPWSEPVLVEAGKGLIDPCPLWDDDGNNYLVYAYAGSRAGIKSVIAVKRLNAEANKTLDEGRIVYDGHELDPTIEGPKFYKRNGYYYIFAPAGGVSTGWQLVLRAKNIFGPYERKVVMDQGSTAINGPHQGAWVDTPSGEDWFIHFQDKGAYGRIVHLQPMKWMNDWPVIGMDKDGDGKGEPVNMYKKPNIGKVYPVVTPMESDDFNANVLGPQWQWQANPKATWSFLNAASGSLRLYTEIIPEGAKSLWHVPNLLLQKFPAEEFTVTTKITFKPNSKLENEKVGLVVMGMSYAAITLSSSTDGLRISYVVCKDAVKGNAEKETVIQSSPTNTIYFRVVVEKGAACTFYFSVDGKKFNQVGEVFHGEPGKWIGAKVGLFATRSSQTNDSGYADIDWFRIEANK